MVNNDFVVSQVSSDQMADEAVVVPVKKVVFDILLLQLGKHVAFFSLFLLQRESFIATVYRFIT